MSNAVLLRHVAGGLFHDVANHVAAADAVADVDKDNDNQSCDEISNTEVQSAFAC
jgi:hypothetical protein